MDKSNVVLIHTGLSASSHAKSHPRNADHGWWEKFIGPNRSIDTNKYFVICTNVLGGCYGEFCFGFWSSSSFVHSLSSLLFLLVFSSLSPLLRLLLLFRPLRFPTHYSHLALNRHLRAVLHQPRHRKAIRHHLPDHDRLRHDQRPNPPS